MHASWDSLSSLVQIVVVNLVLSGDNALVIALVARSLPAHQRRPAILWGSGMAIALRLVLTLLVAYVLQVPGVRFLGAVLLLWIACKLLQDEAPAAATGEPAATSLRASIARIALADFVMSLDNVVAVAGVSHADPQQMMLGLILSVTMILVCSNAIVALMNRFRWVVYAGTAVLALTAAGMMGHDLDLMMNLGSPGHAHHALPAWASWVVRAAILGSCLTSAQWWPRRRSSIEAG